MKFLLLILGLLTLLPFGSRAQYAPQAGLAGSDAISAGSSLFIGWAAGCTIQRGYMDIADTSLGFATSGDSSLALGPANGTVVSLGDSGIAVLTFKHPIYDGPGPDFAVFENGFRDPSDSTMAFLELAFVEVSSDGVNYFRFPANSLTQDTSQIPMAGTYMDASKLNNLAGKYVGGFGTPFDLSTLAGTSGLDVNNVTHVRIIDVIGALSGHVSRDSAGRIINDPYPTPIPTSGFDLDAVGVIHQTGTGISDPDQQTEVRIFPNPTTGRFNISTGHHAGHLETVEVTDVIGKSICTRSFTDTGCDIDLANQPAGIYLIIVTGEHNMKCIERVVKY